MKLPSLFNRLLPKRLWQQIFLFLVLLVILPLIILGSLLIETSQNTIKTSILRDQTEIAKAATGEIRENIFGAQQALITTASILGMLHTDPWKQETAIVELALRHPSFGRISSVGLNGKEMATSELGTILHDRSPEEAFIQSKQGANYISKVRIPASGIPELTMAVPIRQSGEVTGILLAQYNLRGVWDIVDRIKIGETTTASIVDEEGRIIAHHDKKRILRNLRSDFPEAVHDVLAGKVGSQEVAAQGLLVSYAPITNLKWGLIIAQDKKEVFAFSRMMRTESWILIGISILATMGISFVLAHLMSRPIRDLLNGTQRLIHGDYGQTFRIQRRDEMGKLLFSFNRMKQRMREVQNMERLSMIGKSATAIAHELKNSLVLVNTFIQLLPKRHKDKQFMEEFSQTIPKELNSWNAMLKNMMEFSRESELFMEKLDMNAVINDILTLAKWRLKQNNQTLDVSLTEDLSPIIGNAEKLKQVFLNLINNSMEASPKRGKITLVSSSMNSGEKEFNKVVVTNTDEQISPNRLEDIFEPFFTTKENGFGLGLAISKEIVKLHGGRIEVHHQDGKVSFSVIIPAIQAAKSA